MAFMLAATTLVSHAHEATPKHGGIAKTAEDLQFELVVQQQDATLYVEDHDEPVDTAMAKGKLTILNGSKKTEVELHPTGINQLEVKNVPQLKRGAKIIAHITLANDKAVHVRFSIK